MFTLEADRRPLLHYAKELEEEAEALEREDAPADAPATRPGAVEQRQAEQQPQEADSAVDKATPPQRKPA